MPRHVPLALVALAAGCVVQSSRPPVTAGNGVVVDAKTEEVSVDATKVPLPSGGCSAGQVLTRTDTGWACATPQTISDEHTPSVESCAPGQLVAKTAGGWACVDPPDPDSTPTVPGCPVGEFVERTASGWTCGKAFDPATTPVVSPCAAGEVVTKSEGGWLCAPAIDVAHTPYVVACPAGEVVTMAADGWTCAPAIDPAHTPTVPTCAAGEYVRRTATGWECTALVGDLTGDVTGDLTGDVTGTLHGDSYGIHHGNVVGDVVGGLSGNVVGNVKGNVTGDVTGNLAGDVTGNVKGGLTGDVVGNVKGNVTGDVTGDLTGNVRGNVTGNLAGDVTGDVTGNLVGDVTGDVAGNLVGNVTGDVTGDVVGNVTGNVSGTAANVTGVVGVANGGTGAASFSPGALVTMGESAFSGLAPGPNGSVVVAANGAWTAASPASLGYVRRTTAAANYYVRPGGSDTACDGSANVDDSLAARPSCAFATPQGALDALPDVLRHDVTLTLSAGTWRAAAGTTLIDVAKLAKSTAVLTIQGGGAAGTTILSGATAAAPTTAVASRGLMTGAPISSLVLVNLAFDHFTEAAVRVEASQATLDGVTATGCGYGLICARGATCTVGTTFTATGSAGWGVLAYQGANLTNAGTMTLDGNANGMVVEYDSIFSGAATSTFSAKPTATTNMGYPILVQYGVTAAFGGTTTLESTTTHALLAQHSAHVTVSGSFSAQVHAVAAAGLYVQEDSSAEVASAAVGIDCANAGSSSALVTSNRSELLLAGTDPTNIDHCANAVAAVTHSTFNDSSVGAKSLHGLGSYAANLSIFVKGGFPAAAGQGCINGSQCF